MKFIKRQLRKQKRKFVRKVKRMVMGAISVIVREKVKAGAVFFGLIILKDLLS